MQNLQGTLMALCDTPTGDEDLQRLLGRPLPPVPIFVTANDLSRLYAPLVRDGRMDKFYWQVAVGISVAHAHAGA